MHCSVLALCPGLRGTTETARGGGCGLAIGQAALAWFLWFFICFIPIILYSIVPVGQGCVHYAPIPEVAAITVVLRANAKLNTALSDGTYDSLSLTYCIACLRLFVDCTVHTMFPAAILSLSRIECTCAFVCCNLLMCGQYSAYGTQMTSFCTSVERVQACAVLRASVVLLC